MKKGFVVSAILYPLLVIALTMILGVIAMNDNRRKILDNMKLEVSEESETDPEMSNSALYYKMKALEEAYAEMSSRLSEERFEEIDDKINTAKNQAKLEAFPVGSIFTSTTSTNPSSYIGGTWEEYGQGRTLIGVGSNGTSSYSAGATGGSETFNNSHTHIISGHTHTIPGHFHTTSDHVLTIDEMPSHNHNVVDTSGRILGLWKTNAAGGTLWDLYSYNNGNAGTATTTKVGGGASHNHGNTSNSGTQLTNLNESQTSNTSGNSKQSLIQPYVVVYFWKRIS